MLLANFILLFYINQTVEKHLYFSYEYETFGYKHSINTQWGGAYFRLDELSQDV